MPLVGQIASKLDPRALLAAGGFVLVGGLMMLTSLSPQTGESDLFLPLLVRALGTVMMFLPLNLATLGTIPKHEVGAASSFFNLLRQLGGSIGVALLTTLLTQREAFHRAVLVEKLGASDPETLARVNTLAQGFAPQGIGAGDAHAKALAILDATVNQQSAVLSFADTFWAVAAVVLVCLPLIFLLGKPARGAKVELWH